jgi:hypothetical protein
LGDKALKDRAQRLESHLHLLDPASLVRLSGRASFDPIVKLAGNLRQVHVLDLLLPHLGTKGAKDGLNVLWLEEPPSGKCFPPSQKTHGVFEGVGHVIRSYRNLLGLDLCFCGTPELIAGHSEN